MPAPAWKPYGAPARAGRRSPVRAARRAAVTKVSCLPARAKGACAQGWRGRARGRTRVRAGRRGGRGRRGRRRGRGRRRRGREQPGVQVLLQLGQLGGGQQRLLARGVALLERVAESRHQVRLDARRLCLRARAEDLSALRAARSPCAAQPARRQARACSCAQRRDAWPRLAGAVGGHPHGRANE